ncbi:sensor histidine kinase [Paenibacillus tuaregi]|uniref:sensor histidine kinase n=1 Tax=Paenibacillus tuaregi TaxID=1816681 RepID=UPI0008394EAB|nr:HAMP domain-containing sensor histidine kinase [Paenibacillus tuaregi]
MLFMLIVLVVSGLIIYTYNRIEEGTRWLVYFSLASAAGAFSRLLANYLEKSPQIPHILETTLHIIRFSALFIGHSLSMYFLTMYSVVFSNLFSRKQKTILAYIFLIPVSISLIINLSEGSLSFAYRLSLFLWVAPYVLFSCFLFCFSYLIETNSLVKKNRLTSMLIFVPAQLGTLIFMYGADVWAHSLQLHRYMPYVVGLAFIIFLGSSFLNGALGVRIKIHNQMLTQTMNVATSGTTLINHTIKNEATKISYLTDKLRETGIEEKETLDSINESTEHMLAMVNKIRSKVADFSIDRQAVEISALIESAVILTAPTPDIREKIKVSPSYQGVLMCDPVHVKEVLVNLIQNALEGVKENCNDTGRIQINTQTNRRNIIITVSDNGRGIPRELLAKVTIPFFSTKVSSNNHGLGLTYCTLVMQKHNGKLNIESEETKGTSVHLIFPKK